MAFFAAIGLAYELRKSSENKTDDIKISKSKNEKEYHSFIKNTYEKQTEFLIAKSSNTENNSDNVSSLYVRSVARKDISVDLYNLQQHSSFNIENVNDQILQETTSNIVQSILESIKSFVENKTIKDFNYTNDVTKKESFISAILSFCLDLFARKEEKIGEYLNKNPEQSQNLKTIFQQATRSISKNVSKKLNSKIFKSLFKNIYNVALDLESTHGSISVKWQNKQTTDSLIKTFEKLDLIGKVFESMSNLSGLEIDESLKETNNIKSKETIKKVIEHERVTDIFSNMFGIIAIAAVLLVGALIFLITPSWSPSFGSSPKRIKFKTPIVSKVKSIESIDQELLSTAGYMPIDENDKKYSKIKFKDETSISEEMLITDVLFNETKFE